MGFETGLPGLKLVEMHSFSRHMMITILSARDDKEQIDHSRASATWSLTSEVLTYTQGQLNF